MAAADDLLLGKAKAAKTSSSSTSSTSSISTSSESITPMEVDSNASAVSASTAPLSGRTGVYELISVVTHRGRDADGGHYIGMLGTNIISVENCFSPWFFVLFRPYFFFND